MKLFIVNKFMVEIISELNGKTSIYLGKSADLLNFEIKLKSFNSRTLCWYKSLCRIYKVILA